MGKRCLVLISGIAGEAYSLEEIKKNVEVYRLLCYKYGEKNLIEIDYQPIMDRHAILGDTLLDPFRLLLNPNGWAAERYVIESLRQITKDYTKVDVMSHSLGSWIVLKANVTINKLILIASPIGFSGILGRHTVRTNIWKPKIEVLRLYYVYSTNDLVSCFPPKNIENSKWGCKCGIFKQINCHTGHGLGQYLDYLWKYDRGVLLS